MHDLCSIFSRCGGPFGGFVSARDLNRSMVLGLSYGYCGIREVRLGRNICIASVYIYYYLDPIFCD